MDEQQLQHWVGMLEEFAWGDNAGAPEELLAGSTPEQIQAVMARLHSDETLALLIQRDTLRKEAYVELFIHRYGADLLLWFRNWCRHWDRAADLTQDILTRFFEHGLESFDPCRNFRAYLYRAARNTFLDWTRSERGRRLRPLASIAEPPTREAPAPDPDFHERLEWALRQLPSDQESVLRGTIAERGADEIAQALKISRKRVYALLFNARRRVEALLQLPPMTRPYQKTSSPPKGSSQELTDEF